MLLSHVLFFTCKLFIKLKCFQLFYNLKSQFISITCKKTCNFNEFPKCTLVQLFKSSHHTFAKTHRKQMELLFCMKKLSTMSLRMKLVIQKIFFFSKSLPVWAEKSSAPATWAILRITECLETFIDIMGRIPRSRKWPDHTIFERSRRVGWFQKGRFGMYAVKKWRRGKVGQGGPVFPFVRGAEISLR
jgi:hypothetical protein